MNRKIMASSASRIVTLEEVELCESYLLCHMFEEAATLSTSILTQVAENQGLCKGLDDVLLLDMIESAAMVLVQSSRELGGTSDLLDQLIFYFGSITAIPVEVVLSGVCVQVSSGFSSRVQDFLEEFLRKWQFENGKYIATAYSDTHVNDVGGDNLALEVDEYLKVVEFYAVTLLGVVLNKPDSAILWIEKALLPEKERQDLLRRVRSLYSLKTTSLSGGSSMEESGIGCFPARELSESEKPLVAWSIPCLDEEQIVKQSNSRWQGRLRQCFRWFCNSCTDASSARILLGCLIFILCYKLRKKRHDIIRYAVSQVLSVKQAMVDVWQLAFSYQVNPLAAVQSLPSPNQRS